MSRRFRLWPSVPSVVKAFDFLAEHRVYVDQAQYFNTHDFRRRTLELCIQQELAIAFCAQDG